MLLYQSDKAEAFVVLGLEGGSLILHFISVYLEGSVKDCKSFLIQMIPIIPFIASVGLTLFYLKQGGICYSVEKQVFSFDGCEVCDDGFPPWEGKCWYPNGTSYALQTTNIFAVEDVDDIENVWTSRSNQTEYCAKDNDGGPPVNFCFYAYD